MVAQCARIGPTSEFGYTEFMKKFLGILVLGLLKSYPIDYGRTRARLEPKEIKP